MTLDLLDAARTFGQELQDLLDHVLPIHHGGRDGDRQVQVRVVTNGSRYLIRLAHPLSMVALLKNGRPVAFLRISMQCVPDSRGAFLAVARSDFELRSSRDRSPIARLDYLRDAHSVPSCHWNIHAERGTVSHLLASTNADHAGQFSALHFPVGGARMRPCLEDFLHFVIHEFKIDTCAGALDVLESGRETWRRKQVRALVRDAPDDAVAVLTSLGYGVTAPPDGVPEPRPKALRTW